LGVSSLSPSERITDLLSHAAASADAGAGNLAPPFDIGAGCQFASERSGKLPSQAAELTQNHPMTSVQRPHQGLSHDVRHRTDFS